MIPELYDPTVIFTDERGNGIPRPSREDYASLADYFRAMDEFATRVTDVANRAFDDQFRKSLRAR